MRQPKIAHAPADPANAEPFRDAEEAWFWFVQARAAQQSGARVAAGMARVVRPCEPLDVLAVVDRLYRRRRLLSEHLHVLSDYGQRCLRPDGSLRSEARAAKLWEEALAELSPALQAKGIVA